MMQIHISPNDGVPIYLQIVSQVKYLVAAGRLSEGDEIPPSRALAAQLLVNPNTVARAYLELERAGVVSKRHGSGTYVSAGGSPLARRERLKILTERADALLVEALHMNIDLDEVIKLLRERHETLTQTRS
jgi:GntR family transcriptional regulator